MSLQPGARLSAYEVLGLIGAGGMGEVYRATDTKLKRQVALKVLPAALTTDPDRLARFQREAEVLASLNHPNIAAIYGLEDSTDTKALVMELVEGSTLAERIADVGRSLPLDEALAIAKQIAEALEAAHERSIIHRDLKPANIKLRPDGVVKVLDFGLAKALDAAPAIDASQSPTMTSPAMTRMGVILGTAAYMSPEQARGKTVDKRTDIWAFGCVLYEMLTGRRAFAGEDVSETLAAVIKGEPDWSAAPAGTPAAIRRLVRRCLQKDGKERLHDISDARIELQDAKTEAASEATTLPVPVLARPRRERLVWTLLGLAGLSIVALSIPAVLHFREPAVANPEVRLELTTPATTQPLHFAISPDGRRLVFVASGEGGPRLWQRPLDAVTALPLEGTEGAEYPFWSPDSRAIGFFAAGKLKRFDIAGGPPQIVADAPNGRGGAWNRDGTILFAPTNSSGLLRVSASGGEPQPVTKLDPPRVGSHRFPQFLPDGRRFLFFAQGNPEGQGIYLGSLDGTDTTRLTPAEAAGAYIEPDALVFLQQSTLVVRSLDVATGTLTGDPVTVADRVSYDAGFSLGGFSVSAAGTLAYRAGGSERRQLTWFDRTGKAVGVAGEPDANGLVTPALSPDGRRIAVARTVQSNVDMWVIDVLRGGATRFTFDPASDVYGVWSPDGTRIAFMSNRKGIYDLFLKSASGAGAEELLLASPFTKLPTDWSVDGRFLLYQNGDPKTGWDLTALPMMGDRKPILVVSTPFEERGGQFSPDGRWVAYQSNESGRFEIYVQPFPGPGGKWQASIAGGVHPRWRPDGKELFFLAPDAKLMAVAVRASDSTFEAGSAAALFQTRTVTGGSADLTPQYAVSRDGRFLFNVPDDTSTAAPITLVLNWTPGITP
ncbi:MAG: protein kinase domain-containing protein [Vicinamibacterales bacterium]